MILQLYLPNYKTICLKMCLSKYFNYIYQNSKDTFFKFALNNLNFFFK